MTYLYTHWIATNFGRKYVWVFPSMCGIYSVKLFLVATKWKSQAIRFTTNTVDDESQTTWYGQIRSIKDKFQIFGPYYLWKLYTTELFESIVQIYNLFEVYLCSMPVEFSAALCMFLALDCFHSAQFMMQTTTVEARDRQYKIDAFVDFCTTAAPICIIFFGYNVPIVIEEMLSITIFPALMLMLKLSTMFEEIIRSRSATVVSEMQIRYAFQHKDEGEAYFTMLIIL